MKRGKWFILAISGLFFTAALIYTFVIPPSYEASSLLLVESPGTGASDDALAFGFVEATSSDSQNKSTQAFILGQSLQIAERTIARL